MELPSESAIWGWVVTGLGGAVNLVERMAASGVRPTDEHLQNLSGAVDRLIAAIDKAAGCTQHSGNRPQPTEAEHGQETDQPGNPQRQQLDTARQAVQSSDWPTCD